MVRPRYQKWYLFSALLIFDYVPNKLEIHQNSKSPKIRPYLVQYFKFEIVLCGHPKEQSCGHCLHLRSKWVLNFLKKAKGFTFVRRRKRNTNRYVMAVTEVGMSMQTSRDTFFRTASPNQSHYSECSSPEQEPARRQDVRLESFESPLDILASVVSQVRFFSPCLV
jgi:hypothetical protein